MPRREPAYLDPRRAHPHRRLALWALSARRDAPSEAIRAAAHPRHGDLLAFAERNRIGPIVAHAVLDYGVAPATERSAWQAVHDASEARLRVLLDTLDGLGAAFAARGIAVVGLKNVSIARAIYPCAACCPMGDLDLLVTRERFRDAHAALLDQGFTLTTTSPTTDPADLEAGLAKGGSEYVREVGGVEVLIDLQWRAVSGRWLRTEQEPPADALIARSRPILGTPVRRLSATDNMLMVALHTGKHTYCRAPGLRLHTDVDRLAVFDPPDWAAVADQAERLATRAAAYYSLAIAREMFGTPIPSPTLRRMAPPRWQRELMARLLRRADVFEPDAPKLTTPELIVAQALQHDDAERLLATALDADAAELRLSNLPRLLGSGARRLDYLLRRRPRGS